MTLKSGVASFSLGFTRKMPAKTISSKLRDFERARAGIPIGTNPKMKAALTREISKMQKVLAERN